MAQQRVTLRLTELRCLAQSEGSGGSEPYLWTTYFAFGAQQLPFQSGVAGVITPAYDAFRTEFPNGVKAGQATTIPPFIASASFDMDLESAPQPKLIGCIAVLMEEDDTRHSSIILGRIAYSKEIEVQINALLKKRILENNLGPLTEEEVSTIKEAVKSKAVDAIGSNQSIWDVFRNQDDIVGFTSQFFIHPVTHPATQTDIEFRYFDFPEITSGSSNRFVLSGSLSLGPVPTEPVDRCKTQRAALKAKKDEIQSLYTRVTLLQNQLQHATPQQKSAIVHQITETGTLITAAEAQLPALQAALDACQGHHGPGGLGGVITDPTVVLGHG